MEATKYAEYRPAVEKSTHQPREREIWVKNINSSLVYLDLICICICICICSCCSVFVYICVCMCMCICIFICGEEYTGAGAKRDVKVGQKN